MRCRSNTMIALVSLFAATPAWAECSVSSDANVAEKTINPGNQADARLPISMSMMPEILHIDYASVAKAKPSCKLGQFDAGAAGYSLYGDDDNGRNRIAKPDRKGASVATVIPVIDLIKMLNSGKTGGPPAQVQGYFLATIDKSGLTGWRYYTGMPDTDTLQRDMQQALIGAGRPIFKRDSEGNIRLFM